MTPSHGTIADPVVDLLGEERSDYRGLYYRWEKEQWEAGTIDFATDAADWGGLDPDGRGAVASAIGWMHLRARRATTDLVPFVDAAPDEEQQVFLTTELVDEARHVVLFDRFATEVMGHDASTVADRAPDVGDPALRELLLEVLPRVSGELAAADAPDLGLLAEAVTSYQVAIVGMLGLTEQAALARLLATRDLLPGLRAGLALTMRDSARHVAFALRLLEETKRTQPSHMERIETRLDDVTATVKRALARDGEIASGRGSQQAAQLSCAAWLEAVGVKLPV